MGRSKNKAVAKIIITRFPLLAKRFIASYDPQRSLDVPWTPATKTLEESTVAVVTTAEVHHADQEPFDIRRRSDRPGLFS